MTHTEELIVALDENLSTGLEIHGNIDEAINYALPLIRDLLTEYTEELWDEIK